MPRYPSGLGADLPESTDDARVWLAQVVLAMVEQPLGASAPCMNPECAEPVDYLGGGGPAPLYCSKGCRSRASTLRHTARRQLDVVNGLLDATRYMRGVPRDDLQARANQLRWWLARLATRDERTAPER